MKFTLIAVDPVKKHVTFEMEDGVRQTVCDMPVDDAYALERALVHYAENYVPKDVEKAQTIPAEVEAMIGQEKQVIAVKVDDGSQSVMAFDSAMSMEEVKAEVLESMTVEVEEATIVGDSIEIVSVKLEPVEVAVETPVEESVAAEEAPVADEPAASDVAATQETVATVETPAEAPEVEPVTTEETPVA